MLLLFSMDVPVALPKKKCRPITRGLFLFYFVVASKRKGSRGMSRVEKCWHALSSNGRLNHSNRKASIAGLFHCIHNITLAVRLKKIQNVKYIKNETERKSSVVVGAAAHITQEPSNK